MTFLQNLFIVLLYFWWIIRSALAAPFIIGKVLWDKLFNKEPFTLFGERAMTKDEMKATIQKADASVLRGLIDGFFAGLEARATGKPIVLGLLKGANTIIDMVLTTYGLALLLALLFISAAAAQQLPRARDTVESYAGLPRARDYIQVSAKPPGMHLNSGAYLGEDESEWPTPAKVKPPCKNCDCGCPEAPCSCDKPKEAFATIPTASAGEEQEAGVSVPAAQPQRFFRYRPAYQRGRACST